MKESVAIVTPWYPSHALPYRGSFVATAAEATMKLVESVTVHHLQREVGGQDGQPELTEDVASQNSELAGSGAGRRIIVKRVPFGPGAEWTTTTLMRERARALRAAAGGEISDPIVHAHVGLNGGWPALKAAGKGSQVFVTEHVSFLDAQLADQEKKSMYEEVVALSARFFCVSQVLREKLTAAFPRFRHKIGVAPNAVPFERMDSRRNPVVEPRRWLYLGSFQPHKGVEQLLDAFSHCRQRRPSLSLTMVGGDVDSTMLRRRLAELDLQDSVTLAGAVPHDVALSLVRTHDLLVHASHYETFGMTPIEAIACGTPVLVTRCGGPEETLAEAIKYAGELVPVAADGTELASGFERLVSRFAELDLRRARGILERKYGLGAVAKFLARHYFDADYRLS